MTIRKPAALKSGDLVAVLSPSWGGPGQFPHIHEKGLEPLRRWGLRIREYPSTRASPEQLFADPSLRARDINDAFADPEVKAIIATIGGDDSVRLLPLLDAAIIAANPKILLGYSDITTLHVFARLQGRITFYGPTIMSGFAQMDYFPELEQHVRSMLFEPSANYEYQTFGHYCEGYEDWGDPIRAGNVRGLTSTRGWRWLQGAEPVQGELFGGCFEVLEFLKGTRFWPAADFWSGKILFLETSEEKPAPVAVQRMLRNYGTQGILDRIVALLVGRARDYSPAEKEELDQRVMQIIVNEVRRSDLPVVTNMDFGHTDPQFILPIGIRARVDPREQRFVLVEPWLE